MTTYKKVLYYTDPLYAMAENLGTCQGEGDSDGGFVRHTERALRPKAGQGPDEADGNPVHLLRHSHGKRGVAGAQDRAESTACGLLKR